MVKAEKAAGHNWIVFYRADDEPEIMAMNVFGAMTVEKVAEEARWSLDPDDDNPDYEILAIQRFDFVEPPETAAE